jgi:hypothetical protein
MIFVKQIQRSTNVQELNQLMCVSENAYILYEYTKNNGNADQLLT